jgi:hypothetical protein
MIRIWTINVEKYPLTRGSSSRDRKHGGESFLFNFIPFGAGWTRKETLLPHLVTTWRVTTPWTISCLCVKAWRAYCSLLPSTRGSNCASFAVCAVYLTTLQAAQTTSWRDTTAGKECIAKDSEGSDCGIIEAISRRFFWGSEKHHKYLSAYLRGPGQGSITRRLE